jgi:hypothetical protein
MLKNYLLEGIKSLLVYIIKLSLFFMFLSVFIYNLQIQNFDNKHESITGYTEIVQCYSIIDLNKLIESYFYEIQGYKK